MSGASVGAQAGAALAAFLALLFVRAAWHKLAERLESEGHVRAYGVLPEAWAPVAPPALAAAEIAAALALALPATRAVGAGLAIALLLGYATAIALALRAGKTEIDCGCGGPAQPLSPALIGRNLALAALALGAAAAPATTLGPSGAAASVAGGATLWLLYALIETLLANAARMRRPG